LEIRIESVGINMLGRKSQIIIGKAGKSFLAYSVFDHSRNHVGAPLVGQSPSQPRTKTRLAWLEDSARAFANQSYHFPSVKEHAFKSDERMLWSKTVD
jgi:hypothetical protein